MLLRLTVLEIGYTCTGNDKCTFRYCLGLLRWQSRPGNVLYWNLLILLDVGESKNKGPELLKWPKLALRDHGPGTTFDIIMFYISK